jgi:YbbR domain-containing protein
VLTRNWKEKLLAVLLAVLFWIMIKAQVNRTTLPFGREPAARAPRF